MLLLCATVHYDDTCGVLHYNPIMYMYVFFWCIYQFYVLSLFLIDKSIASDHIIRAADHTQAASAIASFSWSRSIEPGHQAAESCFHIFMPHLFVLCG